MAHHPKANRNQAHAAIAAGVPNSHPVLALPAQLVAELPEPIALRLHVPGAPVPVCIWTGSLFGAPHSGHAHRSSLPVLADTIIFDGPELAALLCAATADRLWHADFLGLCFEKWRKPEVRVDSEHALAGANPDPSVTWSLLRLFQRLGVELESVELDTMPSAQPLHAAA